MLLQELNDCDNININSIKNCLGIPDTNKKQTDTNKHTHTHTHTHMQAVYLALYLTSLILDHITQFNNLLRKIVILCYIL
jgi:hypothetical protein